MTTLREASATASEPQSLEATVTATPGPVVLDGSEPAPKPFDVPREHRVFVNRNLRLDKIEMVGFDMDYTLALYNQPRIEELSVRATLEKLVSAKGYPEAIRALAYDPLLALRGLVVDRDNGNIFKPDRYGYPGRARHGMKTLDRDAISDLYQRERTRLSNRRYAWIDTLFALPEAVLYAGLVDYFDRTDTPGGKPSYNTMWEHIRECIDLAHRDGSIKTIVSAQLPSYIEKDEALAETLHKFRSSGKRLFLLTNSAWDYTTTVMSYLLDGALAAYPNWRSYFDVIVVSACKPEFFTEAHPFIELDAHTGVPATKPGSKPGAETAPFQRARIYQGGNLRTFEERARTSGDRVLFVGDHIYGDMLRSRKSSNWRTAMVLQEMEHEVATYDRLRTELTKLDRLDAELIHVDAELNENQSSLRTLQKLGDQTPGSDQVVDARRVVKSKIEELRKSLRAAMAQHRTLEAEIDHAFNPYWGPLFREGYEISKFGEQVEAYACVYTSRVSNFRFYSPMQYFRGPRDRMPHER